MTRPMEPSRRSVILEEIDRWRAEGLLEDDEYQWLRARYDQGRDARLDAPPSVSPAGTPADAVHDPAARIDAYATHLLGGLLLGAALVAVIQYFVPTGGWQPMTALSAAGLCAIGAFLAERARGQLAAEAGIGAALVTAGSIPFFVTSPALLAGLGALLAAGLAIHRAGRTPLTLLAAAAFFVNARHFAVIDLMDNLGGPAASAWLFVALLVGFGALLLRQRATRWGGYALAGQGAALALAAFPTLDAYGVTDPGIAALAVGGVLGALFGIGIHLHARPLVAASGAMLVAAALSFAFLALGPALAALVLLLLGAVLVWQAEIVRGYFAPGARPSA